MKNISINLLPWREELRFLREEKLKRLFTYSAILGVLLAVGVVFVGILVLDQQKSRVAMIDAELLKYAHADKLLKERKKAVEDLTNRIKVLTDLNDQRSKVVELMERFSTSIDHNAFIYTLSFQIKNLSFHGLSRDQESLINYLKLLESKKVGATPIPKSQDIYVDRDRIVDFTVELTPSI